VTRVQGEQIESCAQGTVEQDKRVQARHCAVPQCHSASGSSHVNFTHRVPGLPGRCQAEYTNPKP
jgi:hypothetical protein